MTRGIVFWLYLMIKMASRLSFSHQIFMRGSYIKGSFTFRTRLIPVGPRGVGCDVGDAILRCCCGGLCLTGQIVSVSVSSDRG